MTRKSIDMVGEVVGSWTVLREVQNRRFGETYWECLCACGNTAQVGGKSLRNGHSQGCRRCGYKKIAEMKPNLLHGFTGSKIYDLYRAAKLRARKKKLEFSLVLEDVIIPDRCPLLGIEIDAKSTSLSDNSPTLDRLDNNKGYTKDNVWVVSNKANRMKSNSSLSELELLVSNLKEKMKQ